MCIGVRESFILPTLLSDLSTTEVCLMFIIEKQNENFIYKSRNCSNSDEVLCKECEITFNTLNHFHHLYLKQSCNEFVISKMRGKWIEKQFGTCKTSVIVTFHPAFLMRQPAQKKMAWIDLKMIRDKKI